jgi:SAM-dependent methyltransferase
MTLPVEVADALLSKRGRAALADATRLVAAGEPELRAAATLRQRYDATLAAAALGQVELRTRAAAKFRLADRMLFTRDGLEQASAERAAQWRARRLAAAQPRLADVCCGIGGDLVALAPTVGADVVAVDRDPAALRFAVHNAAVYGGADVRPVLADAEAAELGDRTAVFVDPARRGGGRRHAPGDYTPPLAWCLALAARVPAVAVKAAPGIDLADVPPDWEVEFVADGRDLKEAVLWSPALATAPRRASVLPAGISLAGDAAAQPSVATRPPGAWLIDPNPAVTRAGLVEQLAAQVGAWKIDDRIGFLSADERPTTAYGRTLAIEASLPWDLRELRALLRRLDVGVVDLRRRGLAGDVEDIRRRLRLAGTRRVTVAMTRVADRPWAIVATPVDERPAAVD